MECLTTPVALLVFNRPEQTQRVLAAIAEVQPATLLIVADAARRDRPDDEANVVAVRKIVERVDWPCQIHRNYAAENLGCKRRVSSGLNWVFDTVEEAIVLEDDCLPDRSFFGYCQQLLSRYRDHPRVMAISGGNFHDESHRAAASYKFSKYFGVWGWASWRRAWRHYDVEISAWPEFRDQGGMRSIAESREEETYWTRLFNNLHAGRIDTWDHQWQFACWRQRGLTIVPNVNLIDNIGFGADATHTKVADPRFVNFPTGRLDQLVHPARVERDPHADRLCFDYVFSKRRLHGWAKWRARLEKYRHSLAKRMPFRRRHDAA